MKAISAFLYHSSTPKQRIYPIYQTNKRIYNLPEIVQKYKYFIRKLSNKISTSMRTLTTCSFLNNIGDCPQSIDSPLQMKLINFLGLKNYMIDNFIFRRKQAKYHIRKKNNNNTIFLQSEYVAPTGYSIQSKIIQTSNHSIPICRFKPKHKTNNNIIVYAHGNASDMADSLNFIQRLSQHIHTEYIIFDYTGYGQSRVGDVGEEIICKDLEIILAWLTQGEIQDKHDGNGCEDGKGGKKFRKNFKLDEIILWGFSLGTFPVVVTAAKYTVAAVILQCPIASVCSLFHNQLHPDMKFKQDHFANIDYITQIKTKTKILIMHSSADQIIPFNHGKILYLKYMTRNGENNIEFIQIGKIRHNSLHKYIVSTIQNQLQKQVFGFLIKIIFEHGDLLSSMKTQKSIKSFLSPKSIRKMEQNQKNTRIQSRNSLLQSQLKSLAMKIVEADIAQITGDMQELVIEEKSDTIQKKLIPGKLDQKCFCFPNQA